MGAFTSAPQILPAVQPSIAPRAAVASVAVDPYQEAVLKAQAREAEIRAAVEAQEQALVAQQALAEHAAGREAATEAGRVTQKLTADQQARQAALVRDQGAATASAAARGVLAGGTARALLKGLADDAGSEAAAARTAAEQRLADIRQGLEVRQAQNLLALAEQQRKGQLTLHGAASDTIFTQRDAWLRQTQDRERAQAAYQSEVEAYNRQVASQRRDLVNAASGALVNVLIPRLG